MKLVIDNGTKPTIVEPVAKKKPVLKRNHCSHGGTMVIDEETRLVQCGLCDAWIDAFTALLVLTRNWQQQMDAIEYGELRYQELNRRMADLKREERNIKDRIRTAKRRLQKLEQKVSAGDSDGA